MTGISFLNIEAPGHAEFSPPDRLPGGSLKSREAPTLSDLCSVEKRMSLSANFALHRQAERVLSPGFPIQPYGFI